MTPQSRAGLWKRWLGPDPALHPLFMQQALACWIFFISGIVGVVVAADQGAPLWACVVLLGIAWGCAAGFSLLVRSGWTARFADPMLVSAQIKAGAVLGASMYLSMGPYRGLVIGPLVLGLAFAMLHIGKRETQVLTVVVFAAVAGAALLGTWVWPARFPWWDEAVNVAVLSICIPGIGLLAIQVAQVRAKLEQQERELREALVKIERLATHDSLTGLPNRRHGEQALVAALERLDRGDQPLALALLDLDKFKSINDTHGHSKGDEVLRCFAKLGRASLRRTDLLVRWGGEEFLLLMQGHEPQMALERLQEAVRKNTEPLPFRFSAGWVHAQKGDTADRLIEQADAALYRAKEQGRDRAVRA